jgi:hypothetical protein
LSLEIYDDISIPKFIEMIKKRDTSGKESSSTFYVLVQGRSHINSENTKDFLDLARLNSKSNSWRITIHLEYFSHSNFHVRMCFMGLQLEMTVVLRKKI